MEQLIYITFTRPTLCERGGETPLVSTNDGIGAAIFLESMDRYADPCNDFYEYACGNYERKAIIPEDRLSKRRADEIENYVKTAIKIILEEPNPSKMSALRKAKDLYTACMNMTRINEQGPQPMDDLLILFGEWLGLQNLSWNEHQFNWDDFMITLNNNGLENNFILSVELDIEKLNSSSITIEVSLPTLAIPAEDADRANYLELMKAFVENMGVPRYLFEGQLENVLDFESQLAQLSLEDKGSRREMSVAELAKRFPPEVFSWIGWPKDLISENFSETDRAILNMDESTFDKLLQVQGKTTFRNLHNYMFWRASLSVFYLLPELFQQLLFNYESKTYGLAARVPRWEFCANIVNKQFKHAVGNIYVKNFLDKEVAPQVMVILKGICDEMKMMIMEADWMDDQTRTKALEKAHQMRSIIGHSQEMLNEEEVDKLYEKVAINPQEYFKSMISSLKNRAHYDIPTLLKLKTLRWSDIQTAASHGDYNAARNQIEIPAGMLQKLYFDADRPNYINYAMMGYFIGHEISHGFDNTEPSIVKDGIVMDWWKNTTAKKFLKRANCMAEQFSLKHQINRHKILRGIIADNGGVKAAYRAYKKWVTQNGQETILPYFSLNARQLFWTSYANIWCSKQGPLAGKQKLENEDKIPARFRVNGVVSNSPEFAKDFKCKAGSPMNPG